jgi:hypothetical protein
MPLLPCATDRISVASRFYPYNKALFLIAATQDDIKRNIISDAARRDSPSDTTKTKSVLTMSCSSPRRRKKSQSGRLHKRIR